MISSRQADFQEYLKKKREKIVPLRGSVEGYWTAANFDPNAIGISRIFINKIQFKDQPPPLPTNEAIEETVRVFMSALEPLGYKLMGDGTTLQKEGVDNLIQLRDLNDEVLAAMRNHPEVVEYQPFEADADYSRGDDEANWTEDGIDFTILAKTNNPTPEISHRQADFQEFMRNRRGKRLSMPFSLEDRILSFEADELRSNVNEEEWNILKPILLSAFNGFNAFSGNVMRYHEEVSLPQAFSQIKKVASILGSYPEISDVKIIKEDMSFNFNSGSSLSKKADFQEFMKTKRSYVKFNIVDGYGSQGNYWRSKMYKSQLDSLLSPGEIGELTEKLESFFQNNWLHEDEAVNNTESVVRRRFAEEGLVLKSIERDGNNYTYFAEKAK